MSIATAKNILSELKLKGMLNKLDAIIEQATMHDYDYTEFVNALLQAEFDLRNESKIENKMRNAKFKIKPEIEDFDFTVKRTITKTQLKELSQLSWLGQGRSLVFIGKTGIGKTFLAQALGVHACRKNKSVIFLDISTLLETLSLQRAAGNYLKFREKITRPDLLIIDDFGSRKLNSSMAQDFCEIIEARSYGKSTIVTTQIPFKNWAEVIEDPIIADAIIDRLKHSSLNFEIDGDTYREILADKFNKKFLKTKEHDIRT